MGLRKLEVTIVRNDDTEVLIDEQYNDRNDLPLNLLFVRFPIQEGFLKVSIKEAV